MGKLAAVVAMSALLVACGRIGYDERSPATPVDSAVPEDMQPPPQDTTAPATCPSDTERTAASSTVCIEKNERGNATWVVAKATCEGLGRRLCSDAEWLFACESTAGLVDMAGGVGTDWEWMADKVDALTALKRGFDLCTDESSHEIDNGGYDYRCCLDLAAGP